MDTHHAGGACRAAAGLRCSHLISNGWSYQGPRRVGIQKYVVAESNAHGQSNRAKGTVSRRSWLEAHWLDLHSKACGHNANLTAALPGPCSLDVHLDHHLLTEQPSAACLRLVPKPLRAFCVPGANRPRKELQNHGGRSEILPAHLCSWRLPRSSSERPPAEVSSRKDAAFSAGSLLCPPAAHRRGQTADPHRWQPTPLRAGTGLLELQLRAASLPLGHPLEQGPGHQGDVRESVSGRGWSSWCSVSCFWMGRLRWMPWWACPGH
ncbi:uncharacterized protein LOC123776646 [Ursus americanus]|uniref:uncharacterized protein LOC123776646 n=1 Tax=Ursus americanus TaxID=9643 RepID=UPI001E67CB0E|nr:uncharacterized protein LOC123776646 [Ursus americanus]